VEDVVMKLRLLLVIGALVVLAVGAAVAWYLVSPLLIDRTVD
jgi:Sec-independent protein secretion pathway component TatC